VSALSAPTVSTVLFDTYGDVDRLQSSRHPVPMPGPGQVLVRYAAIGVNPIDWKLLNGGLQAQVPLHLPACLGVEAAGTVLACGSGAVRFTPGDQVIRHGRPGTYRSHELVPCADEADELTPMPSRFDFEQAAVLPVAAGTAFSALHQVGAGPGDRLLVHGASGGVGLATVQLARLLGVAEVIGTASTAHHTPLRELGVVPLEYGHTLHRRLADHLRGRTIDVSVDCAGGPQPSQLAPALVADPLRRVTIVPDPRAQQAGVPFLRHVPHELRQVLDLIGEHPFELPIRGRYPLSRAGEALARGRAGQVGGKLLITPD
jgi:NADPH:quinone reductase-like Zn-dependent oxidoreductase